MHHQKFNFTNAAMAAALEETPITYEDLQDIEQDFENAETEISEFGPLVSRDAGLRPVGCAGAAKGVLHNHLSYQIIFCLRRESYPPMAEPMQHLHSALIDPGASFNFTNRTVLMISGSSTIPSIKVVKSLRKTPQDSLSNPQFLAPGPRTSTSRHRPIHPTFRLRPPPLRSHQPLRLPLRNPRLRKWRSPLRIHKVRVLAQRIFRRLRPREEVLAPEE